MKLVVCFSTLVLLTSGFCAVTHYNDAKRSLGRLHRIDIKAAHPRAYHPQIGDLIQCYLDFPIVPDQIVDDLLVTTAGKSVAVAAVVSTPKPKIIGSGQVSVFLIPRQTGLAKLTIQPVIPGKKTKPIEISFLVENKQE